MQKIKTKSITRNDWPRVPRKSFACQTLDTPVFCGAVALLRLDQVNTPLVVTSCGEQVTLVDNGYYWIQLAPEKQHWWLTAMLDPNGRIYQYYFDITLENRINESNSVFDDLFLDVVALPDGKCEMLDLDELNEALRENVITQDHYQMARSVADTLMCALPSRIDELNTFCQQLFTHLRSIMDTKN